MLFFVPNYDMNIEIFFGILIIGGMMMGALHDASVSSMISKLMDSGLSGEQIDRAMRNMVGHDWKRMDVAHWFSRFREQGLIIHNNEDIFIYDLEALVKGWIKLHDLCK
jgi:hypothetical protein